MYDLVAERQSDDQSEDCFHTSEMKQTKTGRAAESLHLIDHNRAGPQSQGEGTEFEEAPRHRGPTARRASRPSPGRVDRDPCAGGCPSGDAIAERPSLPQGEIPPISGLVHGKETDISLAVVLLPKG